MIRSALVSVQVRQYVPSRRHLRRAAPGRGRRRRRSRRAEAELRLDPRRRPKQRLRPGPHQAHAEPAAHLQRRRALREPRRGAARVRAEPLVAAAGPLPAQHGLPLQHRRPERGGLPRGGEQHHRHVDDGRGLPHRFYRQVHQRPRGGCAVGLELLASFLEFSRHLQLLQQHAVQLQLRARRHDADLALRVDGHDRRPPKRLCRPARRRADAGRGGGGPALLRAPHAAHGARGLLLRPAQGPDEVRAQRHLLGA